MSAAFEQATRGHGGRPARRLLTEIARSSTYCELCNGELGPIRQDLRHPHPLSPSADMIVPWSKGGLVVRGNLRPAHLGCNARRQDKMETPPRPSTREW